MTGKPVAVITTDCLARARACRGRDRLVELNDLSCSRPPRDLEPADLALWARPRVGRAAVTLPPLTTQFEPVSPYDCGDRAAGPRLDVPSGPLVLTARADEPWPRLLNGSRPSLIEPYEIALARALSPLAMDRALVLWQEASLWIALCWFGGEPLFVRGRSGACNPEHQLDQLREWCHGCGFDGGAAYLTGPGRTGCSGAKAVDWRDLYDTVPPDFPEELAPLWGLAMLVTS